MNCKNCKQLAKDNWQRYAKEFDRNKDLKEKNDYLRTLAAILGGIIATMVIYATFLAITTHPKDPPPWATAASFKPPEESR